MFGSHGGVYMTTNLAAIVCVRKSTLYLSSCRTTLPQRKQSRQQKECHGTYQSDEESLLFFMGEWARRITRLAESLVATQRVEGGGDRRFRSPRTCEGGIPLELVRQLYAAEIACGTALADASSSASPGRAQATRRLAHLSQQAPAARWHDASPSRTRRAVACRAGSAQSVQTPPQNGTSRVRRGTG